MSEEVFEVEPRDRAMPLWFRIASIGAIAFYLLGAVMFVLQLNMDPATLPIDQRALWEASPGWMVALAGVSVAAGLLGAVMLVRRKPSAVGWLGLALVAAVAHFAPLLLLPALRNLISDQVLVGPLVILLFAYGLWQLAKVGRRRGLLEE